VNKRIIKPNNLNNRHFPQDFFNNGAGKKEEQRGTSSEVVLRSNYLLISQTQGDPLQNDILGSYMNNDYMPKNNQTI
jgi:hypothetical protein